jgi:hypothetical protein
VWDLGARTPFSKDDFEVKSCWLNTNHSLEPGP